MSHSRHGGLLREFVIVFAATANLLFADQFTKALAARFLKGAAPVDIVSRFFSLVYVENRGCAWGMFQGRVTYLAVFAAVAMAILLWKRRSVFGRGVAALVAESLLYAGILGNLCDRVFSSCVIDFLDFHWGNAHFPVFNLADVFITFAAGMLIVSSFRGGSGK